MGCLSISVIGIAYDTSLTVEPIDSSPEIEVIDINTPAEIDIEDHTETASIEATNCNGAEIDFDNYNTVATLNIVLVCSVGFDGFDYLQVLEGYVILIDGSYVKVLRG